MQLERLKREYDRDGVVRVHSFFDAEALAEVKDRLARYIENRLADLPAGDFTLEMTTAFRNSDFKQASIAQEKISALWKMFELPQLKFSFSYFARSLALATQYRGWCNSAATVVPGAKPDAEFDQAVEQHLRRVGLER